MNSWTQTGRIDRPYKEEGSDSNRKILVRKADAKTVVPMGLANTRIDSNIKLFVRFFKSIYRSFHYFNCRPWFRIFGPYQYSAQNNCEF